MKKPLPFFLRLHLHFPQVTISSASGFFDSSSWKVSDETCHELWHYLSSRQSRSICLLDSKLGPTVGKMALETLVISVGTVEDDFEPIDIPAGIGGRTWIVTYAESKKFCVTLNCPEIDVAKRRSQEDTVHASYHLDEIYRLEHFAEETVDHRNHIIQDAHALILTSSFLSKKTNLNGGADGI